MGNLTRAAYANSAYDDFCETSPKILKTNRNTVIALRGSIHVACFHHSCFVKGVWRCLTEDVVIEDTPLLFLRRVVGGLEQESAQDVRPTTMETTITDEHQTRMARIEAKRQRILNAIDRDAAEGQMMTFESLSQKIQDKALACGLALADVVTYNHTDSYVMCCPCAMQFLALTRISVRVPRSLLNASEPDYAVVYLDEDRHKDWIVMPIDSPETPLQVYATVPEAKKTRFGKLFAIVSAIRREKGK